MSQVNETFLTPVGRLVQGDPFTPQEKDHTGNPLIIKRGPNAGTPRKQWFVAIAIPKTDAAWPALWAKINAVARQGFPTLFDAAGNCQRPTFAWKVVDGDSTVPNDNGKRPCDNEGFPGNWVLRLSGGFPIQCYDAQTKPLNDPSAIKRGYFVRVSGTVAANGDVSKPGLFLNPQFLQLVAFGPEINTGPDGSAIFGAVPVGALPPGASPTPAAPQHAPSGPGAPAPTAGPAPAAAAPHYGILTPGGAPAPAAAPAPAENWRIAGDGKSYSESTLRASGWSEAQIQAAPLDPDTQF